MNEHWEIRHPGKDEIVKCQSFEEAMDTWFEGFNVPFKVENGEREPFDAAHSRVQQRLRKFPWEEL